MRHQIFAFLFAVGCSASVLAQSLDTLPSFTPSATWNVDASALPLRTNSTLMMQRLEAIAATRHGNGKWGGDNDSAAKPSNSDFQIGFDFYVLHSNRTAPAAPTAPMAPIAYSGDPDDYFSPDCDAQGSVFPVPNSGPFATGGIEGTDPPAYTCDTSDDCHLLVSDDNNHILYESYNTASAVATGSNKGVDTLCGLRWDLRKTYPRYGRGEHCTSADGAGFPIAPLLLNADEVWQAVQNNGDIGHAIRFILGNSRMATHKYVHPSSHGTLATSDSDPNAVPYGSHLRLKDSFDITHIGGKATNVAVQAILRSLKKYGMFLSDGGKVPLSGEMDHYTVKKWDSDLGMDSHSLWGINPTDFEVVETGDLKTTTFACVRTPEDFIFIDGLDY
jgi:hypothetical protein